MKSMHFTSKPRKRVNIDEGAQRVLPAAYALAKATSANEAIAIIKGLPVILLPALARHMSDRPNLFLPEVRATLARIIAAPKLSAAEALFS